MQKTFYYICILVVTFLLIIISNNDELISKISKEREDNTNTIQQKKWSKLLNEHPYNNRPYLSEKELKSIPKADRPDLAMEQNFLMTVDPSTGVIPFERLISANKAARRILKTKGPINGVEWEERGPDNVGGRTRALMFDPNDATNKKVWAGGVSGGLWYTNDITATSPSWFHVDDFWDNIAVSFISYNPSNTQELYVGTGEGYNNFDAVRGSGIWKSSNGGSTWTHLTSTNDSSFYYVQKIVINSNGDVYASTKDGVHKSIDGGLNWTKVLGAAISGGGNNYSTDIEIASNGDIYAALYGQIFKSAVSVYGANVGNINNWTQLTLPVETYRRIELACAPSNSLVVSVLFDNGNSGKFMRTTDGGSTWSTPVTPQICDQTSTDAFTRTFPGNQAWYDLICAIDPNNSSVIVIGGIDLLKSTDGGVNWTQISVWSSYTNSSSSPCGYSSSPKSVVHADQHAIVFESGSSNNAIFGTDGGVFYTTDLTNSSPNIENRNNGYNITQFYACATKNTVKSNYFLTGSQDNGSQKFTQAQMNSTTEATGGDGAFCHIDQNNPNIQITSYTNNNLYRSLNGGITFAALILEANGHFINPTEYDSQRKILYAAAGDDQLKRISGIDGTITNTNITISVGGAKISALKVDEANDVLIIGITNGRVYKITNASTASPVVTRIDNALPAGWVSSIDIGATNNQIMITFSNYGLASSIYETTDGGTNWYSKEGNLPDIPLRWCLYNPDNRDQVLIATEVGVWSTDNFQPGTSNAPNWGPSNTGLANTRCDMLKYRSADKMVVVATHGRGLYTTDIFAPNSIADLTADICFSCTGSLTVDFMDNSIKPNNSWAWDVDNDGTDDYTTRNVSHTYSSGSYNVKLSVNSGADDTIHINKVLVLDSEPTTCTSCTPDGSSNSGNEYGIGIYHFGLSSISNTTPHNDGGYLNYACSKATYLELNTTYDINITTGIFYNEGAAIFIDYNNDGVFGAGEAVATFLSNTNGSRSLQFTTPTTGVSMDAGLRLRVVSKFNNIPTGPGDNGSYGQVEDYTVYFATPNPTLPISLSAFETKCLDDAIQISWTTASEKNNDYFTLEKSVNGVDFIELAKINGAGNSNYNISYEYKYRPLQNENILQFRLKQTDFDGKSTFSKQIYSNCEESYKVVLSPNPNNGTFSISGYGNKANLLIINATGKIVYNKIITDNYKDIELTNLHKGIYYVKVFTANESKVIKFVLTD